MKSGLHKHIFYTYQYKCKGEPRGDFHFASPVIDKDRDDTNKKLKEEHDQRRIEQMELVQRLDNNEKCGKTDITVSFSRNILQFLYNRNQSYREM